MAAEGEYPIGVVESKNNDDRTPAGNDKLAAVAFTVAGAFVAAAFAAAAAAVFDPVSLTRV